MSAADETARPEETTGHEERASASSLVNGFPIATDASGTASMAGDWPLARVTITFGSTVSRTASRPVESGSAVDATTAEPVVAVRGAASVTETGSRLSWAARSSSSESSLSAVRDGREVSNEGVS
jgi:hypothetical protein